MPKRRRQLVYAGLIVTTVTATLEFKFQECMEIVGNPAKVTSPHTLFWLRVAFGRTRSRWMGSLSEMRIPVALRSSVYRLYAMKYGVNLSEVRYPLDAYKSFNEFFSRELVDGARPIAHIPDGLISPVDGTVMTSGVIETRDARVEQVKGATYSVRSFLGMDPVEQAGKSSTIRYVVLYLSPGDYHRIHSPCEVRFSQGRHFCGELLPVRGWLLERVSDIFAVNERVVLSGQWRFGQMHLVAVAAANVGNIFLDLDAKLRTNRMRDVTVHCGGDISSKLYPEGVSLQPGDKVGGFKLGSTVVLVFETPRKFKWKVEPGDVVKVGQPLGEAR